MKVLLNRNNFKEPTKGKKFLGGGVYDAIASSSHERANRSVGLWEGLSSEIGNA